MRKAQVKCAQPLSSQILYPHAFTSGRATDQIATNIFSCITLTRRGHASGKNNFDVDNLSDTAKYFCSGKSFALVVFEFYNRLTLI
ncbi:hypothetical protein [Loktanella sp. M215]|uniref:hypothetical protein n=1 Tax=Loktanella sp. M215 TaxID=2675431 RepID=UPI001F2CC8AB|nr:hypothetical protein [Loktanella sp. M215]MCF7698451.1 hypothetical protein [Loktanella sp. M215]